MMVFVFFEILLVVIFQDVGMMEVFIVFIYVCENVDRLIQQYMDLSVN